MLVLWITEGTMFIMLCTDRALGWSLVLILASLLHDTRRIQHAKLNIYTQVDIYGSVFQRCSVPASIRPCRNIGVREMVITSVVPF